MIADWPWLILGAAAGGFVQGVAGFAFGMVAMSIWVWVLDPVTAVAMSVFGGFSGQLFAAVKERRRLDLKALAPMLSGAAIGMAIGWWLVPHLDRQLFRQVLGGLLLVFCPLMLFSNRLSLGQGARHPMLDRWGDGGVGVVGGLMGMLGGFTGTAPAVWGAMRGHDKARYRAQMQTFNLVALGATFSILVFSGRVSASLIPGFALLLPALMIMSTVGARVYRGMSPLAFRNTVLVLLTVAGLTMLLSR